MGRLGTIDVQLLHMEATMRTKQAAKPGKAGTSPEAGKAGTSPKVGKAGTSPSSDWEPGRLAEYAADQFRRAKADLRDVARRVALDVFRAGHALVLLKAKAKGAWVELQERH